VPLPLTLTVSVSSGLNVAVALLAPFIVSAQVPVPEQAPDQPAKTYPAEAEAVRSTTVPYENVAEQVPGQEMPEGELVTVPLPLTPTVSVSGIGLNVALTLSALFIATVQVPVPEQAPDQPANVCPEEGEAVRITVVPNENATEQVPGQEMPEGELVTVPLPATFTVSVSGGPYCVIVAGPSSPEDPKLTYRLPDRVTPVFAATVYVVLQVMSSFSGSGFGVQAVEEMFGVIQLTLDWSTGSPQSTYIVKVQVAVHIPPLLDKPVYALRLPGAQFESWGLAPLGFTVTIFSRSCEPV
jgi:hypothetical protein